jgi:hypothetical protein
MDRKSDNSSPHYDAGIQPTTTRDRVSLGAARDDILPKGSVDPVYQAKAELLNAAIQEIGMGKYQVCSIPFDQKCEA